MTRYCSLPIALNLCILALHAYCLYRILPFDDRPDAKICDATCEIIDQKVADAEVQKRLTTIVKGYSRSILGLKKAIRAVSIATVVLSLVASVVAYAVLATLRKRSVQLGDNGVRN